MKTKSRLLLTAAALSLAACGGTDGNKNGNRVDNQATADPGMALNTTENPGNASEPADAREAAPPKQAGVPSKAPPAAEPPAPSQPDESADPHAGHDMENMSHD